MRRTREAQGKADTIDAVTIDLKAVNPHAHVERDSRTLVEILESIAAHGQRVESALQRLHQLMKIDLVR